MGERGGSGAERGKIGKEVLMKSESTEYFRACFSNDRFICYNRDLNWFMKTTGRHALDLTPECSLVSTDFKLTV